MNNWIRVEFLFLFLFLFFTIICLYAYYLTSNLYGRSL